MISQLDCIGCQACVDFCPRKAISFHYNEWGEGKAIVDTSQCNGCGICELHCPVLTNIFNEAQNNVYAAISKKNHRTGSSGGIFFELANKFIADGGVVFGAAFDTELELIHKKVSSISELFSLCKSKYLHSDMSGIYNEISECLKNGLKVMFVGTPCQVSAVKNAFINKYEPQLLLIDFLCHGTGTQKCFDMCIASEEKKRNGKIVDFNFRAKTRRAEHSFRYKLKCADKDKNITGYSFEFPYYYSYLKYGIFYEACYKCKYAKKERVGDITLGDFWGIQKYNKALSDQKGVSMLSVNTQKGFGAIEAIKDTCEFYEYPIENASEKNEAFRSCVSEKCHKSKQELEDVLLNKGDEALIERLRCPNIKKELIYAKTPLFIKRIWNRIRGRK